jgi:signal transduction histidine kinase
MSSGEAVRDAKGDILRLCGTVEDITERNWQIIRGEESESVMNDDYRISARLIQAQEEENTKIAKELRDHICQKLCLLAVEIQGLHPAFPELTQQAHMRLEELWGDTAETVDDIVRLSHHLYPSELDLLGLPLAVRGFCREFASRNRVSVECSCTDVVLERKVALSFFRVLQEVLGNVEKHSHASNVSVELIGRSRELLLRVSDDGVGLELERTKVTTGLGFIRMKERLRSIGGELAVWSAPTRGTRIEARVPLRESLQ